MNHRTFSIAALVFPLLLAASLLAAEAEREFKAGEDFLEAWHIADAEALAAKALQDNPKSATALEFDGRIKFYQGRYQEALTVLDRALVVDSKDQRRQAMKLLTQLTLDVHKSFKRFESAHFILFADERRDGILVPHALDALEKSYEAIGAELGYYSKEKVRVEIAPDATSFNAISTLSLRDIEETGAVGICKFNKLMIISPRALSFGYRWVDSLSHEYLHYAIVGLSNNQAPIWLHEGMARFYETRWRKAAAAKAAHEDYLTPANQTLLVQALEKNQFVGFKKMEPSLIHLDTPEQVQLAYAEAASAVDFINQSKGRSGIRDLLSTLKDNATPEAIEKVYGMSFDAFETKWKSFLKTKGLKPIEGSRVRRLKVRKDQKEDDDVVELREIQSVIARNRTHLADQLLSKSRPVAALNEYRRALQASPQSPVILNKLGRVMVDQNRADEALPLLKKALDIEPDGVNTYIQLGRAYHAAKNFKEARGVLEEAQQINPFHPLIYRLLGDIYNALGEAEKARQAKATLEKLAGSN